MGSPFPGMDPYLEGQGLWSDFHATFVPCWREAIADVLPNNYEARLDEWFQLVEQSPPRVRGIEPDVSVIRTERAKQPRESGLATATLAPVTIPHILPSRRRQTHIRILHRPDRALVAVLEMLSPANKRSPDFRVYLDKRQQVLHQDVHLVELELLTRGRRLPMDGPLPPGDYYYFVARAEQRPDCAVYAWGLRQPLPTVPVPLRTPDADVFVDLGAVFATAYQRGRYERSVNYQTVPRVAVNPATLAWIKRQRRK